MTITDIAQQVDACPAEALVAQIAAWIDEGERWVDLESINLYAGTNTQSSAVRRTLQTTLGTRPSLGEPGDKYEVGLEYSDRIEILAGAVLKKLFRAEFVEYRVLSGSMANLYAYMSVARPGDIIYAMPAAAAAHATHREEGAAGLYQLRIFSIPCLPGTHLINWEEFARQVEVYKPKLIVLGSSLPLLPYQIDKVRQIADLVGAKIMYDAAHVAGIIAGKRFQDPLAQGADLMTASTYKTFGGPPGGVVLTNDASIAERLHQIAYPGLTANFDMSRLAATAVAGLELLEFGEEYADQCLANAAALADELQGRGLPVWCPDGNGVATRSHLVALDARQWGGGTAIARQCEASNVLFSGIPLPIEWDMADFTGFRLGVQEVTRWGMGVTEMVAVADFIERALWQPERAKATREDVRTFREAFLTTRYGFP